MTKSRKSSPEDKITSTAELVRCPTSLQRGGHTKLIHGHRVRPVIGVARSTRA
jgi:hypothetical protein